jgi:hypothetical protein
MQISRRILLACVTAAALLPLTALLGKDTAAQIKARQALEQQMKEAPAQPASSNQTPAAAAVPQPPPGQPPAVTTSPEAGTKPTKADREALENALHQKMAELPGSRAPAAQAPAAPAAPQSAPSQAPAMTAWPESQAPPTSATSKALEDALHRKMTEMQGQPSAEAPQPKEPLPLTPAPAAQPAPVPTPTAAMPQPAPAETPAMTAWPEPQAPPSGATSKALEDALRRKMTEMQGQPSAAAPQPKEPTAPTPAPEAQPAMTPSTTSPEQAQAAPPSREESKWGKAVAPPGATQDQLQKAQEALEQKVSRGGETTPAPAPKAVKQEVPAVKKAAPEKGMAEAKPPASATAVVPSQPPAKKEKPKAQQVQAAPPIPPKPKSAIESKLPPLPTPQPAVSASKELRLEELLQLYRSDKITPEQYHERRAKILAEP